MTVQILKGHAIVELLTLPPASIQCCVTSPPYWGLRDYGTPPLVWGGDPSCVHQWGEGGKRHRGGPTGEGSQIAGRSANAARDRTGDIHTGTFCLVCRAWRGQLGLEPTPELYVEHLVDVFRALRPALRDDGTLWLNLGDCYMGSGGQARKAATPATNGRGEAQVAPAVATSGPNRSPAPGLKPKDLVMIPARVAMALQADGWWVRSDVIWSKPNPMPESVRDRPTKAHEYVWLLTKSEKYYFDADAIAEPLADGSKSNQGFAIPWNSDGSHRPQYQRALEIAREGGLTEAHIEAIRCCGFFGDTATKTGLTQNGTDNQAMLELAAEAKRVLGGYYREFLQRPTRNARSVWTISPKPFGDAHFALMPPELAEKCILAGTKAGDTVVDPFGGAGTTGLVADRLGRNAVLVELNPKYVDMAGRRIADDAPLFHDGLGERSMPVATGETTE